MDEKTIIYTLATVIATVVTFLVRRELSREKDKEREVQNRIKDKDEEIERLTNELQSYREWKDKLYEEAIQRRLQNGTSGRG